MFLYVRIMSVLTVNELLEGLTLSHLPSRVPPRDMFYTRLYIFYFILGTCLVDHIYYIFIILHSHWW